MIRRCSVLIEWPLVTKKIVGEKGAGYDVIWGDFVVEKGWGLG